MAANTGRVEEIEAMMADPSDYRNSRNVIAVNREYATLEEKVARLTTEWEGLVGEAERTAGYRKRQEDLLNLLNTGSCPPGRCLLTTPVSVLIEPRR